MTAKMESWQELKANVLKAQDRIKRLTAVCWKLTKERDALAEDNLSLQLETFQWQDKVYNMKMSTKSALHRQMYPKRSQRIYENLRIKKQNLRIKKTLSIKKPKK